jgi:hypothetical protein
MGRACSTNGDKLKFIGFLWESQKERDYYKDLDLGRWMILRLIVER